MKPKEKEVKKDEYIEYTFSFTNNHPDFKKIKVKLFDYKKENEGVLIGELLGKGSYERFKWQYSDEMNRLAKVRVQSYGLEGLWKRNFWQYIYCVSVNRKECSRSVPCYLGTKMDAYQFSNSIIDFTTNGLDLFTKDTQHDMEFFVYPETTIILTFYLNSID